MNKKNYKEILYFPDNYIVNEVYRRIEDENVKEIYDEIIQENKNIKYLIKKLINYVTMGYMIFFLKSLIAWFSLGYLVQISYMFYKNNVLSYFYYEPELFVKSIDMTGIHEKVFIFVVFVMIIKIIRNYFFKKVKDDSLIKVENIELAKAYDILKCDHYDDFSYIKRRVGKIIARNKHETKKTLDAYIVVANQYSFDKIIEKNNFMIFIKMYIKNIMIVLAGAVAKFIAIVPFFYLFVYIRIIPSIEMMNGIAKKNYLASTKQYFGWTLEIIKRLPFHQYIPLLDGEYGDTYAFFVFIGLLMVLWEMPQLIIELKRQYIRAKNFTAESIKCPTIKSPQVTIYNNSFKNKFNVFRIMIVIYIFVYFLVKYYLL